MPMSLTQNYTSIQLGSKASFLATGGVKPFTYSVVAGGLGGTIDARTGWYTAPLSSSNGDVFDKILATDNLGATASAEIFVGTPAHFICDIIRREMSLPKENVYLWSQKNDQPKGELPWVVVSEIATQMIGRTTKFDGITNTESNGITLRSMISIDIKSRSLAARDRRWEVPLALASQYALQQAEKNGFMIARNPSTFVNISGVDGAAVPYRFSYTTFLFYAVGNTKSAQYYDNFSDAEIYTDP